MFVSTGLMDYSAPTAPPRVDSKLFTSFQRIILQPNTGDLNNYPPSPRGTGWFPFLIRQAHLGTSPDWTLKFNYFPVPWLKSERVDSLSGRLEYKLLYQYGLGRLVETPDSCGRSNLPRWAVVCGLQSAAMAGERQKELVE